jgi:hypothetical protein
VYMIEQDFYTRHVAQGYCPGSYSYNLYPFGTPPTLSVLFDTHCALMTHVEGSL